MQTKFPKPHRRHALLLAAAVLCAPSLALAQRAEVERVEVVAEDALAVDSRLPANHWGRHQSRITRHADGSVRVLYLQRSEAGDLAWRVLLRRPQGGWREEAEGHSTDDVNLLRDPSDDRALVHAWPRSVPTLFESPRYEPDVVPGPWERIDTGTRHYSALGISPTGVLCLKATASRSPTGQSRNFYSCGERRDGGWRWGAQQELAVGPRLAYDYLFPSNEGSELTAVAQLDVHRDVLGQPQLSRPWVFNGVRAVRTPLRGRGNPHIAEIAPALPVARGATEAPILTQSDALIDRRGRLVSIQFGDDPADAAGRGFYGSIGAAGQDRFRRQRLEGLPAYGWVRVAEDEHGRLWLLWNNKGSQGSQMTLHRLQAEDDGDLRVGPAIDLARAFGRLAMDGPPFLAVPRGGSKPADVIDGVLPACERPYEEGAKSAPTPCYSGGNTQRFIYFRIRLPD